MIRFRSFTAAVVAAGLLVGAGAVQAQGPPFGGPGWPGGLGGPDGPRVGGPDRPGGPGGPGGLPLRELNLTDAQREQLQGIRQQHAEEMKAAEEKVRLAMDAQRRAIESVPLNEALVRSAAQQVGDAQTELAVQHARIYSETWAVLTPAQQAQAKKLEAELRQRAQNMRERQSERRENRRQAPPQ